MYKHILVAVDESAMAQTLVDEALSIRADQPSCRLSILHVSNSEGATVFPYAVPPGTAPGYGGAGPVGGLVPPVAPVIETDNTETEQRISRLEEIRIAMEQKGIPCEVLVKNGDPASEICECANEQDADLIVVGCREKGALEKLFLGSVSQKVVQESSVPVLVVK